MTPDLYSRWCDRYRVVRSGLWWRIQTGTGTRLTGRFFTQAGAMRLSAELMTAFFDGRFVGMHPELVPNDTMKGCKS
jgi:hypothetical protein